MAIVEIESKVYNVPFEVASKLLDSYDKIEELEMEVRKLKKDVLDGEIHWHSQKQKRLAEKRKKLKYKQRLDKALEYINSHDLYIEVIDYDYEENPETTMIRDDIAKEDLSKILKGEENENN